MHGVGDGVPAFKADHGQRVDRQFTGKHRQKPCDAAAPAGLPVNSVVIVLGARVGVHGRNQQQVEPHAKVGKGQVTD